MSLIKLSAWFAAIAQLALAMPVAAAEPAAADAVQATQTCLANAGDASGSGATLPAAIDGSKFRRESDLKKALGKSWGQLAYVKNGDFKGWKLKKLKGLRNICFENIDFSKSDWEKTSFDGIGFIGVKLTGADMSGARLRHVLLRTSVLDNVKAVGTDFSFGQMDGGWSGSLENLDARNAKFNAFRFHCGKSESDGCPFNRSGVKITGADFSNASLINFALWDSDWTGIKLDNAVISYDQAGQFKGASISDKVQISGGGQLSSIDAAGLEALATSLPQGSTECDKIVDIAQRFFCENGNDDLSSYVEDVAYLTTRGTSIQATGQPLVQYRAALDKCMQLADAAREPCMGSEVLKRRGMLIAAERTPDWVARENFAAFAVTPLDVRSGPLLSVSAQISASLADASSHLLLIRKNAAGQLEIRARYRGEQGGTCHYTGTQASVRNYLVFAGSQRLANGRSSGGIPVANLYGDRASFDNRLFGSEAGRAGQMVPCEFYRDLPMKKLPMFQVDFDRLWDAAIR